MAAPSIPRFDAASDVHELLMPFCRLKPGETWEDPESRHRIGVADAVSIESIKELCGDLVPTAVVNDPPYNIVVGSTDTKALSRTGIEEYIDFSRKWVQTAYDIMADNGYLYTWLGADQTNGFQPLPDFMIMMRDFDGFVPKSFITMRNQRGYGTRKNWMFVRQELLCYAKGSPLFEVVYTDIPKILKGYYKKIGGKMTENMERSRSDTIRPGNVWVDIQQVFYRMEENVPGAYAQKPLKSIERILLTSTEEGAVVADFFCHSGTTLIAAEKKGRKCVTCDIDPLFAELTIRRLEHYRNTGKTGWQMGNPFPEIAEWNKQDEN